MNQTPPSIPPLTGVGKLINKPHLKGGVGEVWLCKQCQTSFTITNQDQSFYDRIAVPAPTLCPQCRLQRRLAWRNEHNLYQRNCDLCHKTIISMYRADAPYTVYCQDCWWSDKWDSLDYAQEYNPTISFFKQYDDLRRAVPRVALTNTNSENSEYTNYAGNNKNCYLLFANSYGNNENCGYGVGTRKCHNSYDTLNVVESELVYDSADSSFLHRVVGAVNCVSCTECWMIEDCSNCQNCLGCKGLRNKRYCIFNQQYSPEDYAAKLAQLQLHTEAGLKSFQEDWDKFRLTIPSRYSHQLKSENCTGDYITNSTNCTTCFDVHETENSKCIKFSIGQVKDSYDVSYTGTAEQGYEDLSLVDAYNCKFCNITWWSVRDLEYCELCFNTASCFGSISLRKQKFCILNKQYSETEYHELVGTIKQQMIIAGEYGEFPPAEQSPFHYEESVAEDFFPTQNLQISVSADISKVADVKTCQHCSKAFKLIPAEIKFYETMGLPQPGECFNCRHLQRLNHKNAVQLWTRQCMKPGCSNSFETTYDPDRKEIVYCEQCYQKEMY